MYVCMYLCMYVCMYVYTMVCIHLGRRVSSVVEHSSANPKARSRSHTGVMEYDEARCMHLTPGVVHNFPKAVGV